MQIRKALFNNAIASVWAKLSVVIIRLVQIPLLISALGVNDFGRWLVLYSIPGWLSLTNIGFGIAAANEVTMAMAIGNEKKANGIYATTIFLIIIIGIIGSILIAFLAPFFSWESFLNLPKQRHNELVLAVIWLSIIIFISFYLGVFASRFRAARKAHLDVWIYSAKPWFELLSIVIVIHNSHRLDYIAAGLLVANIIFLFIYQWLSYWVMPSIKFSFLNINKSNFRLLFQKGISFQAITLGNALLFQGNLLVVQSILGSVAVALFGTARTLVRTINQLMELVNQVTWPEFSLLLGTGDLQRASRLHRLSVAISVIASLICVALLSFFGQWLYNLWIGNSILLPKTLLLLFLLPIPFNALWFTSSVVHTACNKHEGLAIRYLLASFLSFAACIPLSYFIGMEGVALSTLIVDIVLIPYVLKRSLILTSDTWKNFYSGLKEYSRSLPAFVKKL